MATTMAPTPLFQGVDKNSAGYKLLASMGWREGDGLGAKKQGIKEHVKVKKKHDAMGVGAVENATSTRDWTTGMVSFESILANLKEVTAAKPPAADEDSSSDDEPQPPKKGKKAGKAKKAAAAGSPKKRKAPAASSGDDSGPSTSGSSSGSDSEDESAAAKRAKLASHVGRYSKRERAKFVKNYSASDLDAILGGVKKEAAQQEEEDDGGPAGGMGLPPGMAFMPIIAEVRAAPRQDEEEDSDEEAEAGGSGRAEEEGAGAKPKVKKASKASTSAPAAAPEEEWEPGKKPWWAGMFIRAGRMGSIKQELKSRSMHDGSKAKITITGFKEEDQENLYEQAQHGAAHGRQGLGRSDMPKKVAGARWCGTKTKLDDGDEVEEEAEASGSGSESESEDDDRIVVVQSKKEQEAAAAAGAGAAPAVGSVKAKSGGAADGEPATEAKPGKEGKRKRKERDAAEPEPASKPEAGKPSKKAKKGKAKEQEAAAAAPEQQPTTPASPKQPKWRKLVRQLLADAPERRLKLRRLSKQLSASHGLGGEDEALTAVLEQLRGSKKFRVCEKFVTLTE
ncbi:hypothetical protein HYH03_005609 [Edaphochlamys debaryana]|uniref:G-patch domain-containing protein n=1 Tax=Edaphochlamys debaryana TaxID=47281 RepID=A0A835Y5H8_9CHLO|nr:hypothetical protein HYH03_005609 [Edaphochlamys debaryana]|eukprot:KAG2496381.1 hypothetical protein HYH03_005609 [Edaphochlamys debaryana]